MALLYMCCYPSPKRIGLYTYEVCVLSLVGGLNRSEYAIGNLGGGECGYNKAYALYQQASQR